MDDEMIIGVSARPEADAERMHDAGIGWVRQGFPVPWADGPGGPLAEGYVQARETARRRAREGFGVLGVTPLPLRSRYQPDAAGRLELHWKPRFPHWFPAHTDPDYGRTYAAVCEFLAGDLEDTVRMWQVANELDIPMFAGPLGPREAADLMLAGARGLERADPSLVVGTNTAGAPAAYYLYGRLYADPDGPLDYAGVDGYAGTWGPGGPEDWAARIAEIAALTGRPVLVNEWGFASRGEVAPDAEADPEAANCQTRTWRHTWGPGHTPEGQAAYLRAAFEAFRRQRDRLAGVFFYRWEDQERCWQCGREDCPMETAWGLVDRSGRPKPALAAFAEGAARLRA